MYSECKSCLFKFLFFIQVQLMDSVVLVSGLYQRDSVMHIYIYILFQILLNMRLSSNLPSVLAFSSYFHIARI